MEVTSFKLVVTTSRTLPEGSVSDYPGIHNIQHLCAGPGLSRTTYLVSVSPLHLCSATELLNQVADDHEAGAALDLCFGVPGTHDQDDESEHEQVGALLVDQRETALFF